MPVLQDFVGFTEPFALRVSVTFLNTSLETILATMVLSVLESGQLGMSN